MKQGVRFNFENTHTPTTTFTLHEYIIEDRGSKYSVSYGNVSDRDAIKRFLTTLKKKKKYAKATHNSWAARIAREGAIFETRNDDGETGAGKVILSVMQKQEIQNCVVCVTRWFGGTKLMGDRFKHLQNATKHAANAVIKESGSTI